MSSQLLQYGQRKKETYSVNEDQMRNGLSFQINNNITTSHTLNILKIAKVRVNVRDRVDT